MHDDPTRDEVLADDVSTLAKLGYSQELARRMSGFSNYAISLSIICILAGGITSFHLGFNSVGGAAIGIGWPLGCLFSLVVALTMGQVASAFPTAGGLYHWASILGGRGWGWATAWFNLAGLITVLAAINVGTYQFTVGAFLEEKPGLAVQIAAVAAITFSQALFNHLGTDPAHKKHILFDVGHSMPTQAEVIRETVAWLDQYERGLPEPTVAAQSGQ